MNVAKIIPLLKFSRGNAKLGKSIYTFSLPSGHSCPNALECLSKSDRANGKIKDGPHTRFRCFSASQEALYGTVRNQRWHNFEALKGLTSEQMQSLIFLSIPSKARMVRIHVGGDFFSQAYFDAWVEVARMLPNVTFYAYTKSLPYWVSRIHKIPSNLILTASRGGRRDEMIKTYGLREAVVVFSVEEAEKLGLPIDHDDSHAYTQGGSFALLIHGTQPSGSDAGKAKSKLKGVGSYGRGKNGK
jgi:hypothetical protein